MNYTNFSIDRKTGMLVTTSKTPKEGYVENEYTVISTKEVKKNYKRSVESIEGDLKYVGLKTVKISDVEIDKAFVSLQVDADNIYTLELDVFSKNGGVEDYVKSLCQFIQSLSTKKGSKVTISANRQTKDKKGFLYRNLYFKVNGEKLNWDFQSFGDSSPVPKAVQVPDKVTKKLKWDFSDIDAYYYGILEKYKVSNNQSSTSSTPAEGDAGPAASSTANETDNENFDDLPF